jgi:hypothetical protein
MVSFDLSTGGGAKPELAHHLGKVARPVEHAGGSDRVFAPVDRR